MFLRSVFVLVFALTILPGCKRDDNSKSPPPQPTEGAKPTPPADDTKEREKFEGTWLAVETDDLGGKLGPEDKALKQVELRWIFKGTNATVFRNGRADLEDGSLYLDVSQNPKRFELRMKSGRAWYRGIYEVEGDTMRVCIVFLNDWSEPYPTEFTAKVEAKPSWYTYKFKKQP